MGGVGKKTFTDGGNKWVIQDKDGVKPGSAPLNSAASDSQSGALISSAPVSPILGLLGFFDGSPAIQVGLLNMEILKT